MTGKIIVLYILIKFLDRTEDSELNGSKHSLNLVCS
jgi:hypothetical protein